MSHFWIITFLSFLTWVNVAPTFMLVRLWFKFITKFLTFPNSINISPDWKSKLNYFVDTLISTNNLDT